MVRLKEHVRMRVWKHPSLVCTSTALLVHKRHDSRTREHVSYANPQNKRFIRVNTYLYNISNTPLLERTEIFVAYNTFQSQELGNNTLDRKLTLHEIRVLEIKIPTTNANIWIFYRYVKEKI